MIRRTFLKLMLATPLAGLFKKSEPEELKSEEYSISADDIRAAMKDIPNHETTGTTGGGNYWVKFYGYPREGGDVDFCFNGSHEKGYAVKTLIGNHADLYENGTQIILCDGSTFINYSKDVIQSPDFFI